METCKRTYYTNERLHICYSFLKLTQIVGKSHANFRQLFLFGHNYADFKPISEHQFKLFIYKGIIRQDLMLYLPTLFSFYNNDLTFK